MDLTAERHATLGHARGIIQHAKASGRPDLTDEEHRELDADMARVHLLDRQIKSRTMVNAVKALGGPDDEEDRPRASVFSPEAKDGIGNAIRTGASYRTEVNVKALTSNSLLPPVGSFVQEGLHPNSQFPLSSLFLTQEADGAPSASTACGNDGRSCLPRHREIDCLVAGGTPMVIEVKSHSVTDPGRRGSRSRLERVAKDLLERSFDQTRRAAEYISSGGRGFASREGEDERVLLSEEIVDPVQVVISFEDIDPLAFSAADLIGSKAEHPVWVTDLADLLMVRDVLWDPASFLDYARKRGERSRVSAYVESDALVWYLEDRLEALLATGATGGAEPEVLGHRSGQVNDYYTKVELGLSTELPGLGVPDQIRQALKVTGALNNSTRWWEAASAIMALDRAEWTRWKRFHRRDRTDRVFTPQARTVAIMLSATAIEAQIESTADPTLLIVPAGWQTKEAGHLSGH
jgi:hypothetical protein